MDTDVYGHGCPCIFYMKNANTFSELLQPCQIGTGEYMAMRKIAHSKEEIMADLKCSVENCTYNESTCAVRETFWWAENVQTVVTTHAVKVFRRGGRDGIPLRIPHATLPRPSALTVKRRNVPIIQIISVRPDMWTSRAAEPATVRERPVQHLKKKDKHRIGNCVFTFLPDCGIMQWYGLADARLSDTPTDA